MPFCQTQSSPKVLKFLARDVAWQRHPINLKPGPVRTHLYIYDLFNRKYLSHLNTIPIHTNTARKTTNARKGVNDIRGHDGCPGWRCAALCDLPRVALVRALTCKCAGNSDMIPVSDTKRKMACGGLRCFIAIRRTTHSD